MLTQLMTPIPEEYKKPATQQGKIIRVDYETAEETKHAYVYQPYDFDPTVPHDIYYLLHGGGGSAESLFGREGDNVDIKNAVDHLIENGEMPPVLMVAATYYTKTFADKSVQGSGLAVKAFPEELTKYLIPAIEGRNAVPRDRRFIGGFSMGSVTTWYALQYCLDYFYTFLPMCGDSWALGEKSGGEKPEETVRVLEEAVKNQGYGPDDFFVYAMDGTKDISYPNLTPMMRVMEHDSDLFIYGPQGNTVYLEQEGGLHTADHAKQYFFFALKDIYS